MFDRIRYRWYVWKSSASAFSCWLALVGTGFVLAFVIIIGLVAGNLLNLFR